MSFTERYDMVQQLAAYGPDPSLSQPVLPGASDRCPRRLRAERLDQPINGRGELGVAVVDEVARALIEWEGIAQLLCDLFRPRRSHHVEMDDSPPCMIDHNKDIQHGEHDREIRRAAEAGDGSDGQRRGRESRPEARLGVLPGVGSEDAHGPIWENCSYSAASAQAIV